MLFFQTLRWVHLCLLVYAECAPGAVCKYAFKIGALWLTSTSFKQHLLVNSMPEVLQCRPLLLHFVSNLHSPLT